MREDKLQLQTQVSRCVFSVSAGPRGTLPVFHRAARDMGAVTGGAPEARAVTL